jgi:F0F1-type ATP synthase alpha subunit
LEEFLASSGFVNRVGDGVAKIGGLLGCAVGERVVFSSGVFGMIYLVEEKLLSCILLGSDSLVHRGDSV